MPGLLSLCQYLWFIFTLQKHAASGGVTSLDISASEDTVHLLKYISEDIAPVNERWKSKALTPPVTMKNFFKPVAKPQLGQTCSSGTPRNCDKSEDSLCDIRNKEVEHIINDEDSSSSSDKINNDAKKLVKDNKNNSLNSNRSLMKGTKRNGNDLKGPKSKKAKQETIFSSFLKQKSVKEQRNQEQLTCPICQMTFEEGTSNTEINKHVDNCLIE